MVWSDKTELHCDLWKVGRNFGIQFSRKNIISRRLVNIFTGTKKASLHFEIKIDYIYH